jgi:hypothetical protein
MLDVQEKEQLHLVNVDLYIPVRTFVLERRPESSTAVHEGPRDM